MILVRPRLRLEPLIELSLLLGATVGLLLSYIYFASLTPMGNYYLGTALWFSWTNISLSLSLFIVILSCFCQRRLPIALCGYVFSFGAILVAGIRFINMTGSAGHTLLPAMLIPLFILSLLLASIGAVLAIVICMLLKATLVVVLEQDGTLCANCGYKLMIPNATCCSECGAETHKHQTKCGALRNSISFLYRRSRYLTIIVFLVTTIFSVRYLLVAVAPMMIFNSKFLGSEYNFIGGYMLSGDYYNNGFVTWKTSGYTKIIKANTTKAIVIYYEPVPKQSQPIMQIRLLWAQNIAPGFAPATFDGVPAVMANLNKEQAEYVIENGIPQTLIDAMLKASSDASWPTKVPALGARFTVGNWDGSPTRPVIVQAEPHSPRSVHSK